MQPVALTIAGSDPSGGAGIQADLKTFHQFGVYGEAVITLLTVQNTMRVSRVVTMDAELVIDQLRAVLEDIPPAAAKTGALGNAAIVEAVAEAAVDFSFPLVVDPVLISKHGALLIDNGARESLIKRLIPRASLVTPNIQEAEALTKKTIRNLAGMRDAARRIADLGAAAVLVKGGHLEGIATDVLYAAGEWYEFPAPRIDTTNTHGTGCTCSAAVTAELARGTTLPSAVARAKTFTWEAIRSSPGLGRGAGPVNHHAATEHVFAAH
ncbi:MAG: bifunctional hydroxymethylpyrimidine kinase/phosphomethylpyrimidine kinase [Bryobacterales bacterium]|nr:bifunctional hydroxymethylpyrimidine kinase/phosphomethylpyrimidine kinase [Bryobacterales bacterium]